MSKVLDSAKEKLFEAIDSVFKPKQKPEVKPNSKTEETKTGDKKIFEDVLSGFGVDAKESSEVKEEAVFNDTLFSKLEKQDQRFAAIADDDPTFASEVNSLSEDAQEEIMSFIRGLDSDTRGKISLAFLSGNLESVEEAVDDIQEKTRFFEEVPLEDLKMDELYDLANKIVEAEEKKDLSGTYIPKGHRLYDYFKIEISNDPILKDQGEESLIDNITAGFSAHKSARTEKLSEIIRSSIERYIQDNPEESNKFGSLKKEGFGQDTKESNEGEKMNRMKEEYKRLLKERYTVQKVTLKIMADFLRSKK